MPLAEELEGWDIYHVASYQGRESGSFKLNVTVAVGHGSWIGSTATGWLTCFVVVPGNSLSASYLAALDFCNLGKPFALAARVPPDCAEQYFDRYDFEALSFGSSIHWITFNTYNF